MSESDYKAELAKLRAENERLKAAQASNIRVEAKPDKDGRKWIHVKGIPGTGWGFSAQPNGWEVFLKQVDSLKPQIQALMQ